LGLAGWRLILRIIEKLYDRISWVSEWSVKAVSSLVALLIIVITFDVIMRYAFNAPTRWAFSLSYMLGGSITVMALASVYYHDANVRVDIFYSKFSPKGRLIIDLIFTTIFFFPLFFMLSQIFWQDALWSFSIQETAGESTWYPLLWPYKTILALGFSLVLLQGIAKFMKDILSLAKGGKEPW
jgi:TRAP-type mannitol/chloroaromatic compound transport system permease small subunit